MTWQRAKIPNSPERIAAPQKSAGGLQELGDAILEICNRHIEESMERYGLGEIGYARLIIHKDGDVTYFEK